MARPGKALLVVLGLGIVAVTGVLIAVREEPNRLPIPSLDLSSVAAPRSSLFGQATGSQEPIRYNEIQTSLGVILPADRHTFFICAGGGPILGSTMQNDDETLFWAYEYTGNEIQNQIDGKTGRNLFDGRFFISDGQINAAPGRYDFLNTMTEILPDTHYYFMTERDLSYACSEGIELPPEAAVCGNGIPEQGEDCDDGNTESGDGCSALCVEEFNYHCSGTPSVCEFLIPNLPSLSLLLRTQSAGTGGSVVAGTDQTITLMRFNVTAGPAEGIVVGSILLNLAEGSFDAFDTYDVWIDANNDGTVETPFLTDIAPSGGTLTLQGSSLPIPPNADALFELRANAADSSITSATDIRVQFATDVTDFVTAQTASGVTLSGIQVNASCPESSCDIFVITATSPLWTVLPPTENESSSSASSVSSSSSSSESSVSSVSSASSDSSSSSSESSSS